MTELEKRASQMKWDPPPPGSKERDEMPASAFLSPSTKTFPYKIKVDGEWVISEKGLRSAITVANFRGNTRISARASTILEDLLSDDNASHSDDSEYLQHFGVLGMRWGVRKDKNESREKMSTGKKIAIGLGITAAGAAAAAIVYNKIQKTKTLKISELKKIDNKIYKRAGEFLNAYATKHGKIPNTSLGMVYGRAFVEGDSDLLRAIWDATGIIPSHT